MDDRNKRNQGAQNQGAQNPGALIRRHSLPAYQPTPAFEGARAVGTPVLVNDGSGTTAPTHTMAYAGLYLFTLLLYIRPQEVFPGVFDGFPLIKIVAIGTLLAYFFSCVSTGSRLTVWPFEVKMVLLIVFLGVLFTPIAASKQDSLDVLLDTYLKVVIMFVLMINVLNTRDRLRSVITLSVVCGAVLATFAFMNYASGNFAMTGRIKTSTGRIAGLAAEGLFGNPNDLAACLVILMPFSVALAFMARDSTRRFLYFAVTALLAVGVVVTFSRGGFLGLLAVGVVLLWKLSRRSRGMAILAFILATGVFLVAMPSGYSSRLTTIFSIEEDPTGSAQARRELLTRAMAVAANHMVIGVGMGNFHIYSIKEQVAHNSFLEIAAELGVAGLVAFLALILAPLRSLRRIERQTIDRPRAARRSGVRKVPEDDAGTGDSQVYYLSVALQTSIVAFIVCGFFGSLQYHHFVYYPVAYAIALRQIYGSEQAAGFVVVAGGTGDERRPAAGRGRRLVGFKPAGSKEERETGVLWRPGRARRDPAHGLTR